ncbi:MAG TPA: hypothetical protein VII71_05915 [Verrucomicrobiae bacterium]
MPEREDIALPAKDLYQFSGDLWTDPATGNLDPAPGTLVPNELWCNPGATNGDYGALQGCPQE